MHPNSWTVGDFTSQISTRCVYQDATGGAHAFSLEDGEADGFPMVWWWHHGNWRKPWRTEFPSLADPSIWWKISGSNSWRVVYNQQIFESKNGIPQPVLILREQHRNSAFDEFTLPGWPAEQKPGMWIHQHFESSPTKMENYIYMSICHRHPYICACKVNALRLDGTTTRWRIVENNSRASSDEVSWGAHRSNGRSDAPSECL